MSEREAAQAHFDRLAARYARAAETWQPIYDQAARYLNPLIAGKDLLDVGNGGVFAYDPRLARSVIALDISPEMLARIDAPNVRKVVGDARDLSGINEARLDVVLFVLSLHHINGRTVRDTLIMLDRVLASVRRVLRPGGHLVIVEPVVNFLMYRGEVLLFPLSRTILGCLGVSMVFLYTEALLRNRMARSFCIGEQQIRAVDIVVDQAVDVLGATFPGWLVLPSRLRPTRYCLLQAQRPV